MADAHIELTLSPAIDTVFDMTIGGKKGDVDKDKQTLKNVETHDNTKIHVRLILGGFVKAPWSIVVTVKDGDDSFETDPVTIDGQLGKEGGFFLNKDFPLKKK